MCHTSALGIISPHSLDHAQPGPQDGHQADLFAQQGSRGYAHGRLYVGFLQGQVGGGFIGQEHGDRRRGPQSRQHPHDGTQYHTDKGKQEIIGPEGT
jgi:hypothetical protein